MNPPARRLLMVHYYFPPAHTAAGVRLGNFYREAQPYFSQTHVITSTNRRFFPQDPSLETGCRQITEIAAYDLRWLRHQLRRRPQPHLSASARRRPLVQLLQRLSQSFPSNLLIGDGGLYYLYRGYQEGCRLVRQHGITHLFSSYRPYADHLIAYWLKRRFPHLVWIADFRDLQVDPVLQHSFWPAFQWWCNRQVLKRAEVVSTVSEGLKKELDNIHNDVRVLRNGYQPITKQLPPVDLSHQFLLVYTGSLYGGKRNPLPVFEAIRKLINENKICETKFRLVYAGGDSGSWRKAAETTGLIKCIKLLGYLPRQEALQWQQYAHINLLITWSQKNYGGILTGKLYEYLAMGNPILSIVHGPVDQELKEIVKKGHPDSTAFFDAPIISIDSISEYIFTIYKSWQEGKWYRSLPPMEYQWPYLMKDFMQGL